MGMENAATIFREHADALEPMPLAFNQYVPGGLVHWKGGEKHADYGDYPEVAALYDTIDVTQFTQPDRMAEALRRLETAMVRNLIFTLDMTRTDIGGLLVWALYHAATDGHVLDELVAEIEHGGDLYTKHSLANRMVSETLRLEQSEHLFRRAGRDIEIGDYRAPAGWLVRVCTQESHHNPEVFADPDRYDPGRFLDPSWDAAEYAPFGIDGHSCIGEALTRRFTSMLLVRIARGYDVVVTDDGPLEMGEFQHWTPSSDFRIRLVPREANSPTPNHR